MASKLHINVAQGVIDVEGDEELIREIYSDFREQLLANFGDGSAQANAGEQDAKDAGSGGETSGGGKSTPTRRQRTRKRKDTGDGRPVASDYLPTRLKDLDVSGLKEFFEKYEPRNQPERILIFAKFLQDKGHDPCNADQIFTCFMTLKERLPKVPLQALRDAHGRNYGFIDYQSPAHVKVTLTGENHFNHDLKMKAGN